MISDFRKYSKHKSSAKIRGIDFKLTFEEWLDIWQTSGFYEKRGRGRGTYVMSRYNDTGAYEIGNVFIQSNAQNIIDAKNTGRRKGSKHTEETKNLFSLQRKGKPKTKEWIEKIRQSNLGKKHKKKIYV
jgi:hypothetical protein